MASKLHVAYVFNNCTIAVSSTVYLKFHPCSAEGRGRVKLLLNHDPPVDSLHDDRGGGGRRRYRHGHSFVKNLIICNVGTNTALAYAGMVTTNLIMSGFKYLQELIFYRKTTPHRLDREQR